MKRFLLRPVPWTVRVVVLAAIPYYFWRYITTKTLAYELADLVHQLDNIIVRTILRNM